MADELEKQLLHEMKGKLPENVCPAHSVLMLYVVNTHKEMEEIKGTVNQLRDYIIGDESVENYKKENKASKHNNKLAYGGILGGIFTALYFIVYVLNTYFKH